jgi:membrane fusion protein (multidrug efflux system)
VRIALDPQQIASNPLRVGLSMDVEVDVSNQAGKTLADVPRDIPVAQAPDDSAADHRVDDVVRRVIAANGGGTGKLAAAPTAVLGAAPHAAASTAAVSAH